MLPFKCLPHVSEVGVMASVSQASQTWTCRSRKGTHFYIDHTKLILSHLFVASIIP